MDQKFLAVIVAGIALFGLIFVIGETSPGDGISSPQQTMDKLTLYSHSVGKVGDSNSDFRTIDLGSFTVGEARGDIRGYYNSRDTIEDKMLSGQTLEFSYNATAPREAEITFDVLGRENKGAVYVIVNGEKVFEEPMITESSPKITVPPKYLSPGMNDFKLGVKRPGIFSSSEYVLEDIELRVNDRKFHDHKDNFRLYNYELEDFVDSSLKFDITRSIKTAPLEIFVNGNKLYSKPQVRISPEKIKLDPSNADLNPGGNLIEFRTDDNARYDIGNAQMTIRYLGNVDTQTPVLNFQLNRSELEHVNREQTQERIKFNYQNLLPSPRKMRIDLNEFNTTFTPENGINTIELPEGTVKELNRVDIRSNGTYKIKTFDVVSEKVEEE